MESSNGVSGRTRESSNDVSGRTRESSNVVSVKQGGAALM